MSGVNVVGVKREFRVEDVSVSEVWTKLNSSPGAQLVDVRSRAEWTFVGLPDLSSTGKTVLTVEWQTFPDNQIDPQFGDRLLSELQRSGGDENSELFFICRSGGRSRMAAEQVSALGQFRCHNVADGFEGPLNAERHRGAVGGWKAAGLPWVQG